MSKKTKTAFFCKSCGYEAPKWLGKCPACMEWNTFSEEIVHKEESEKKSWSGSVSKVAKPKAIDEIDLDSNERIVTQDGELNRVLGGGIVRGSLILIGGEPGIGKSTLMLQIALSLSPLKVLYVTGEESEQQIKMRAERLNFTSKTCFILAETNTQNIFKQIENLQPDVLIVDSVQTLHTAFLESASGSVGQVRESTGELMRFAKESGTPVFLIGHITKDGSLAGPKVLEHMTDTVLQFEGDRHLVYRILRTTKNRYGSTSELGIYEMRADGLRQVVNPSEILISQREENVSGISIGTTMEGNRPLLIETQALVSPAAYGTPQRSATGFDARRLNMLLAVLEKRCGYRFGTQDVFLNIAGGLRVEDPGIDLSVCVSMVSSLSDNEIENNIAFTGEVGLGGEIRPVSRVENRISEAEKLGFEAIYVSKYNMKGIDKTNFKIRIHEFSKLDELFRRIF